MMSYNQEIVKYICNNVAPEWRLTDVTKMGDSLILLVFKDVPNRLSYQLALTKSDLKGTLVRRRRWLDHEIEKMLSLSRQHSSKNFIENIDFVLSQTTL
jgi:hypothetical protein